MAKIKITQIVSRIGSTERQKRNLDALGIKKMGQSVVHEGSPIILGMVEKVKHLVKVEPTTDETKAAKKAASSKVAQVVSAETAEAPKAAPKATAAKTAPKSAPKKPAAPKAPKAKVEPVKEK